MRANEQIGFLYITSQHVKLHSIQKTIAAVMHTEIQYLSHIFIQDSKDGSFKILRDKRDRNQNSVYCFFHIHWLCYHFLRAAASAAAIPPATSPTAVAAIPIPITPSGSIFFNETSRNSNS